MAVEIQEIFLTPGIAIARLGAGTVPQEAFQWAQSKEPRAKGETIVTPDWSLMVEADATVTPYMPTSLRFRDGAMIRPVCPFIEAWARVGEPASQRDTWQDVPITPALLSANGVDLQDVTFVVTAINTKAARRTRNPDLSFGTFPAVAIAANDHRKITLAATSPAGVAEPMIPAGRTITLGAVQVMRSRQQPAAAATTWNTAVNVEVLRVRFTPATGRCYGPPAAAGELLTRRGEPHSAVDPRSAFLNPNAGWADAIVRNNPATPQDAPDDTFDGADVGQRRSIGIIDDTCEARVEISFGLPAQGRSVSARATVFVAPPDFAPDRRPFLSLADEINDRSADAAQRNASMSDSDREQWVEDLFERIYETVSLFNIDYWRSQRAADLTGEQLGPPIPGDATPNPKFALGGEDALRNRKYPLPAPDANKPLPLTQHARMRHRTLSDIQGLRDYFRDQPENRFEQLVRMPFTVRANESGDGTTMAMPALMRNSNALPLTLTVWQYDMLKDWVARLHAAPARIGAALAPASGFAQRAQKRRTEILQRLQAAGAI